MLSVLQYTFVNIINAPRPSNVHLNNTSTPVSDRVKYLGVIFNNTSSWIPQIQNLKSKCFKKLDLLKKLAHTSNGSDRLMLIKLYHTLIRPIIDYGAPLYSFVPKSRLDFLNVIHNTCLRLIIGAFRTTPTVSLICEAAEPPLNIVDSTPPSTQSSIL